MNDVASRVHNLTSSYLDGTTSIDEVRELEQLLREDEEARVAFLNEVHLHDELKLIVEPSVQAAAGMESVPAGRVLKFAIPLAAAAALLLGLGYFALQQKSSSGAGTGTGFAYIKAVRGDVTLTREKETLKAAAGLRLRVPGDRLETSKTGGVTLGYDGETTDITLASGSVMETRKFKTDRSWYLVEGKLSAQVTKQSDDMPLVIVTPHGKATVVGTRFGLDVVRSHTRLDVGQGKVNFKSWQSPAETLVKEGHYAVAAAWCDPVAVPLKYDSPQFSGLKPKLVDGGVLFADTFESGPGGWVPWVATGPNLGRTVRKGKAVSPDRVSVVDVTRAGKQTRALKMDSGGYGGPLFGAIRPLPSPIQSFSVEGDIYMPGTYPDEKGRKALVLNLLGLTKPTDAKHEVLFQSPVQQASSLRDDGEWDRFRLEYILETDASGREVLDIKAFLGGQFSSWRRITGSWSESEHRLYTFVGNAGILLDNIVARRLVAGRVTEGVLATYHFDEGKGGEVKDTVGVGEPLNLRIRTPKFTQWIDDGLRVTGKAGLKSATAGKLCEAWNKTGGVTFEYWVAIQADWMKGYKYAVMDLVFSKGWFNYTQAYDGGPTVSKVSHYVVSLKKQGKDAVMSIYENGNPTFVNPMKDLAPTLSKGFHLQLPGGDAPNMDVNTRPWTGEYYYMTIYGRALEEDEVIRNFRCGVPEKKASPRSGRILFQDDFESGLGRWKTLQQKWSIVDGLGRKGSRCLVADAPAKEKTDAVACIVPNVDLAGKGLFITWMFYLDQAMGVVSRVEFFESLDPIKQVQRVLIDDPGPIGVNSGWQDMAVILHGDTYTVYVSNKKGKTYRLKGPFKYVGLVTQPTRKRAAMRIDNVLIRSLGGQSVTAGVGRPSLPQ